MVERADPQTETVTIPKAIANEVNLFINLLLAGEVDSFSDLLDRAGFTSLKLEELPVATTEIEDCTEEIRLTRDQEEVLSALKVFTESSQKYFRLTGYAGTGKSFTIVRYMDWLKQQGRDYIAACPTNKAAKNLRSLARIEDLSVEVKTVAQLLGQQPELDEDTGKEQFISADNLDFSKHEVIIIDEFSMLNKGNFRDIVREVNASLFSKVVFVGDNAQLAPVGESEPIVASSDVIQVSGTLSEIVRYDGDIARVAEEIRSQRQYAKKIYPFTTTKDNSILCLPQEQWLERAIDLFTSPEYLENADHIRFLAWTNRAVANLNQYVRNRLWGRDALPYLVGDRLIARRPLFRIKPGAKGRNKWGIVINNSEEAEVIEPGELCEVVLLGYVYKYWKVRVKPETGNAISLAILHQDSAIQHREQVKLQAEKKKWEVYYDLSRRFDDIGYSYALTTHKAQGSSIDYVFLDVNDMRGCGDRQKLLYTAITRAKRQALIPS